MFLYLLSVEDQMSTAECMDMIQLLFATDDPEYTMKVYLSIL